MVCSGLSVFGNSIVRLATVTGVSSVSSERGGARQARHYMDPPLVPTCQLGRRLVSIKRQLFYWSSHLLLTDRTIGVKEACSTSCTAVHTDVSSPFHISCSRQMSEVYSLFDWAWGLNTITSEKVCSYRPHQNPFVSFLGLHKFSVCVMWRHQETATPKFPLTLR